MESQRNHFRHLVFSGLFILMLNVYATAQAINSEGRVDLGLGGINTISGMVLGPSGQRITTRINVRLSTMTIGDFNTQTNERGDFSFRGLPAGTYTVIIDKEQDFETFSQAVTIIQLRGAPPQVYNVNVRLISITKAVAITGVVDTKFANVSPKAIEYYEASLLLSKEGKHELAIEQLKLAVKEYPDFMLAHSEIGVQYLRLNELEKADKALETALTLEPNAFAPLVNRGIVLFTMKRYEDAETVLKAAFKQDSESAVVNYFYGQALANLGRFDEAEKMLKKSIMLGGDAMKEAHRVLAIIYMSRGDKKKASVELETYLRLNPNAGDAEQLRSVLQKLKV